MMLRVRRFGLLAATVGVPVVDGFYFGFLF